ncbi:MAG TPA: alpha/beta hydrolase-fold protein [Gaiellaceae bacterium]
MHFALPDPERQHDEVQLGQEIVRPRPGPHFEWEGGAWHLDFPRPEVDRLEYLLGVDGEWLPDPGNPLRAPGPFGDKSVVEWPEYAPPAWLDSIADAGPVERFEVRCRRLVARVQVHLYSTPDPPAVDAPLVIAHDGPEYAEYASLTRFLDVMSWEERIPPLRAALIQPVDRDETLSASALYAGALVRELIPAITKRAPHGCRIGMGASLGALAMLHAHRRHPKAFDGLLLQSGSYFRQRWDKYESGFERYRRITRFVGTVLNAQTFERPIPVAITVGAGEENRANNEAVAEALTRQGYPAWLALIRDAHTWTCWRDAFDPHLPALIEAAAE